MAGDWIKMRLDLRTDPAVFKLAALTKLDRFAVVGRLAEFWGWIDKHAVDGVVDGATSQVVDDVVSHDGFAEALVQVNWLLIHDDGIEIPNHNRHNGESGKERSQKNERQARYRAKKDARVDGAVDASTVTQPSTREEKRREDIEPKGSSDAANADATAKTISIKALIAEGVDKQKALDWLVLRKAKRLPLTPSAWADTVAEGGKVGLTPAETVAHAVSSNWAGFKASWYARDQINTQQARASPQNQSLTVPGRQGVDPALAKVIADGLKAAPPSQEIREKMKQLTGARP